MQNTNSQFLHNFFIADDEIDLSMGSQRIFDEKGFTGDYALSKENMLEEAEDINITEKNQVFAVLTRMKMDMKFLRSVWENGSRALEGYSLSKEACAAIITGDINWIKNNYKWNGDELTADDLSGIKHFLEIERW